MDDDDQGTRHPTLMEVLKRASSGVLEAAGVFLIRVHEALEPVHVRNRDLFEEMFGTPDDDDGPIVASFEIVDDDDQDGEERMNDGLYLINAYDVSSQQDDLAKMRDALIEAGAHDAAAETADLLATIRQFEVIAGVHIDRLRGVWKQMEMWRRCKSDREDFEKALAQYRQGMK